MTKMNSKIEGNTLGILRQSFFPFNALGMPSFNNSVVQKLRLEKKVFSKKWSPELIFINEKKNQKILSIFDTENQVNFGTF